MAQAKRDDNRIPTLLGVTDDSAATVTRLVSDPATGRLKVAATIAGSVISGHFQTDTATSTNNQTTFVPSQTLVYDMGFYVNGSRQSPSTNYSIIGGSYVLNSGIPSGCDIILCYVF